MASHIDQTWVARINKDDAFWCCFYASGVIGSLVVYGLLQERIMTIPYGNAGTFQFSVFLIFLNRFATVMFALFMARKNSENLSNKAPLWKYLVVSFSNVLASTCQYEALKYVSFAVQMLGKSFKMMPVMVWGIFINGKQYGWKDWAIASAVTGGVTVFLMTGPTIAPTEQANNIRGLMLLLTFLAFDGLTSTMQERLFKEDKASKYNQMMYVNLLSAIVSLTTLIINGTIFPSTSFFLSHGRFTVDAIVLSASACGGQFFIYSLIKDFGALVFAAVMNVRQVTSIIVSYLTYHHQITRPQVFGLLLVFGALFYKSLRGSDSKTSNEEKRPLATTPEDSKIPDYLAADKHA